MILIINADIKQISSDHKVKPKVIYNNIQSIYSYKNKILNINLTYGYNAKLLKEIISK